VYESVDVVVRDTSPARNPISGVLVRVYDIDGKTIHTQAMTDYTGHAGFLLPADLTFQLRFFKERVGFTNPQYILVSPAPALNIFDVACDVLTPPISTNGRLCVANGYFKRVDGSPAAWVDMHFIPQFGPVVLDGDLVVPEQLMIRTNAAGYAEIPLIRYGKYNVTMQGFENYQRCIAIPDAPNVNLADLLFPVVDRVLFNPTTPVVMSVGEERSLSTFVFASDGNLLPNGYAEDTIWTSSDQGIVTLHFHASTLILRAFNPGVAEIRAVRSDQTVIRIPDRPIQGLPLVITVQ
jgi:hypothetical protein